MESKYQRVMRTLREDILAGTYKTNDKLPTESEMMVMFQVSRDTIRRAVGQLENDGVIYRVQGAGMFVQDKKNKVVKQSSKIIGVITTHIADYIFPRIISGIDKVISQEGYSLLISNTHNNHQMERKSLINMLDLHVSGLIIEPTQSALENPNLKLYQEIVDNKIPSLFINAAYPGVSFPSLITNDENGEKKIVDYLFSLGHESILGVFQVDDLQGIHRMRGFVKSCQKHLDISYKSNIVMYKSDYKLEKITDKIEDFLQLHKNRPTAIACYNDELAIKLIDFLKIKGYAIPNDISVVGFDNYEMSQYLSPSLTTVTHEQGYMGEKAGQMICKLIKKSPVSSISFEPRLVVRNSATQINSKQKD